MNRPDDLTAAVRSLDAAGDRHEPRGARAKADLEQILATELRPGPPGSPASASARRHHPAQIARRVGLAAGAVAALTAGVLAVPSLSGGDQAFASWTPNPRGMTAQERTKAPADCRDAQKDGAGAAYADVLRTAEPVIAERRGVWTTVVLAGAAGFSAMCITDDSASRFTRNMIGSVGKAEHHTAPGPRELVTTELGTGSMDAGAISLAAGTAFTNVVKIVYASPTHAPVAATVSAGHFALWLPGDDLEDAATNGVEVQVTYRDGSTGTRRLSF